MNPRILCIEGDCFGKIHLLNDNNESLCGIEKTRVKQAPNVKLSWSIPYDLTEACKTCLKIADIRAESVKVGRIHE